MMPPGPDAMVAAVAAKVLAQPVDRRLESFAAEMQRVLDRLAELNPRSPPRALVRMAQQVGKLVLARLQHAEASSGDRR